MVSGGEHVGQGQEGRHEVVVHRTRHAHERRRGVRDADVLGLRAADRVAVRVGVTPKIEPWSQPLVMPCAHAWQVPSFVVNGAMTKSPTDRSVTSAPTDSTTPTNS